jgi:hypothetical protein
MRHALLLPALMVLVASTPSLAGSLLSPEGPVTQDVFGLVGEVFIQLDPPEGFELDNRIFGLGYQVLWGDQDAGQVGGEIGLAARLGGRDSVEAWAGIVSRYNFDMAGVRIAPALTIGLSAVSDTMEGGETRRIEQFDGNGNVLFYLGPELSLSSIEHPEFEVFTRLHHRSGGWGTLGGVHGAADVLSLGLRYKF